MKELSDIYKEVGQQFIDDLFKDYLTVTEKLSGSSFSFEKDNNIIKFYKSNDKPINLIDRTLMVYYESAISYIKRATLGIMTTIPDNWRFCFQYFVHNEPGVIQYDNLPKNNLVLTHIQIKSASGKIGKIIEDPRVIGDWANALNVTPLLPVFKGYLTDIQKQKIRDFISTPKEDHAELFKTSSFASYLIHVLNPSVKATTLQSDLAKPIDSIVFKFYKAGSTQMFSAKMIDPYTLSLMKDKKLVDLRRVPADINEILLLDILAFIEERGLKKGEILSISPDERYLELVSSIFNDYIIKRSAGLKEIDIEKAEFAKGDEFKLNIDLIPSESTKNTLRNNERMQDLFKIMLGSLRKKRNPDRGGNVLTPSVINDFNLLVDKIEDAVNTEVTSEFKTFGDYLNLKNVNESDENADELVIKEKSLSINEFVHLNKINLNKNTETMKYLKSYDSFYSTNSDFKIAINRVINEKLEVWKQTMKDAYFNMYPEGSGGRWINPSGTGEIIRAYFIGDDTEAEIEKFLEINGIKSKYYGGYLKTSNASGSFDSWEITMNTDSNWFGKKLMSGETYYIINARKVSSSGVVAVIGDKDTTPDSLKLTDILFPTQDSVVASSKEAVSIKVSNTKYMEFIHSLIDSVKAYKVAKRYDDILELAKSDSVYEIPFNFNQWEDIDKISIASIAKDFGEVLGGIFTFNLLNQIDTGLIFPAASNNALIDFKFDNLSISSKAGKKGGAASASGFLNIIDRAKTLEKWTLSEEESQFEKVFSDIVLAKQTEPLNKTYYSGRGSGTYSNTVKLFNLHLDRNSGWHYWISQSGMTANDSNRDMLFKSFLDLRERGILHKTLNTYSKKIGGFGSLGEKTGRAKITKEIMSAKNEADASKVLDEVLKNSDKDSYDAIIGIILYGSSKELTNFLNNNFGDVLTSLINKAISAKQLYLNTYIKKNKISFEMKSMKTANFKIKELNGVGSWDQRGLAIEMK